MPILEVSRLEAQRQASERLSRMMEEHRRALVEAQININPVWASLYHTAIGNRIRGVPNIRSGGPPESKEEKLVDHGCNPMCAKCLPNVRKLLQF